MPALVTCAAGGRFQLSIPDIEVWTWGPDAEGFRYRCPVCRVRHMGTTTRGNLVALIDFGAICELDATPQDFTGAD